MTYLDVGFNHFLERPVPKPQEQSEFDAESFIQGLSGSSIVGGAISSTSGNLTLDLENGELLSSDGRIERKNLPSPQIIVDVEGNGDFAGIQEAINYAHQLDGGTILIRPGIYRPATQLKLYNNIYLVGEDTENSIIDFTDTDLSNGDAGIIGKGAKVTDDGTITVTTGSATVTGVATEFVTKGVNVGDTIFISQHPYTIASIANDLRLELTDTYEGVTAAGENYAIVIPISNIAIENLTVQNISVDNADGIRIDYGLKPFFSKIKVLNILSSASESGLKLRSCFNFAVLHSEFKDCSDGIIVTNAAGEDKVTNGTILNCYSYNNNNLGLQIASNCFVRVTDCNFSMNRNTGVDLSSDDCNIIGCQIERNLADGITVDGSFNTILGNSVIDNDSDGVVIESTDNFPQRNRIIGNEIRLNGAYGINIAGANATDNVISNNTYAGNTSGKVNDAGTDTIRATRPVPITPIQVVTATNAAPASYVDVDVTANTSANAYMVAGRVGVKDAVVASGCRVRKNGSSTNDATLQVGTVEVANVYNYDTFIVELDSDQIFEYSASGATVDNINIVINGYWEYID